MQHTLSQRTCLPRAKLHTNIHHSKGLIQEEQWSVSGSTKNRCVSHRTVRCSRITVGSGRTHLRTGPNSEKSPNQDHLAPCTARAPSPWSMHGSRNGEVAAAQSTHDHDRSACNIYQYGDPSSTTRKDDHKTIRSATSYAGGPHVLCAPVTPMALTQRTPPLSREIPAIDPVRRATGPCLPPC